MSVIQMIANRIKEKFKQLPVSNPSFQWERSIDNIDAIAPESATGLAFLDKAESLILIDAVRKDLREKTGGKHYRTVILELIANKYYPIITERAILVEQLKGVLTESQEQDLNSNKILYSLFVSISQEVMNSEEILFRHDFDNMMHRKSVNDAYKFDSESRVELDAILNHARPIILRGKNNSIIKKNFGTPSGLFLDVELIALIADYASRNGLVELKNQLIKAIKNGEEAIIQFAKDQIKDSRALRRELLAIWIAEKNNPFFMDSKRVQMVLDLKPSHFTLQEIFDLTDLVKAKSDTYDKHSWFKRLFGLVPQDEKQAHKLMSHFQKCARHIMKQAKNNNRNIFSNFLELTKATLVLANAKLAKELAKTLKAVIKTIKKSDAENIGEEIGRLLKLSEDNFVLNDIQIKKQLVSALCAAIKKSKNLERENLYEVFDSLLQFSKDADVLNDIQLKRELSETLGLFIQQMVKVNLRTVNADFANLLKLADSTFILEDEKLKKELTQVLIMLGITAERFPAETLSKIESSGLAVGNTLIDHIQDCWVNTDSSPSSILRSLTDANDTDLSLSSIGFAKNTEEDTDEEAEEKEAQATSAHVIPSEKGELETSEAIEPGKLRAK